MVGSSSTAGLASFGKGGWEALKDMVIGSLTRIEFGPGVAGVAGIVARSFVVCLATCGQGPVDSAASSSFLSGLLDGMNSMLIKENSAWAQAAL